MSFTPQQLYLSPSIRTNPFRLADPRPASLPTRLVGERRRGIATKR